METVRENKKSMSYGDEFKSVLCRHTSLESKIVVHYVDGYFRVALVCYFITS